MPKLALQIQAPTVDQAIKAGLRQIGLSQEAVCVRIDQMDYSGIFRSKDALVTLIYDATESEKSLAEKKARDFRAKFQFRIEDGVAAVKVPASFFDPNVISTEKERVAYILDYVKSCEIHDPDGEAIKILCSDPEAYRKFCMIKVFDTTSLNNKGARIHISVTEDGMVAKAMIFHHGKISEKDIFRALKTKNIVRGIKVDAIVHMLEQKSEALFVIAEGKPAADDKPGPMEFFFREDEHKEFATMMAQLTIDTRSIKDMNIADRNQLLLRVGDVIRGEDGYKLDGTPLLHQVMVEDISLNVGGGATISDDRREVYAAKSGHIVWKKDQNFIDIEPVYTVEGNVDYKEGNINGFVGKVIVMGDVRPKFSVIAEGDIEIRGSVEDAVIESKRGSVFIGGTLTNGKEGHVTAAETVHIMLANNAHITSKTIIVEKEAINSNLTAHDKVLATGNPGTLLGGSTKARHLIRANVIGSENEASTKVYVGEVIALSRQLRKLRQRIAEREKKLAELKRFRNILENIQEKRPLNDAQSSQLQECSQEIRDLEDDMTYECQQRDTLTEEMQLRKDAKLEAIKIIYPHVDVNIYDGYFLPAKEFQHCGFKCSESQIIQYPL